MKPTITPQDRASAQPPTERLPAMTGLRTEAHCLHRIKQIMFPHDRAFIDFINMNFPDMKYAQLLHCLAEMNDNRNIKAYTLSLRVGIGYADAARIQHYLLKTVYA